MNDHVVQWRYGHGTGDRGQTLAYFRALKLVIGADGIADAEWKALRREMQRIGAPKDLIDDVASWEATEPIEDLLPIDARRSYARMLLYDAIRVAFADGVFHPKERDLVDRAAEFLRVDRPMARVIEGLVEMELAAARVRHELFHETRED